MLDVGDRAPEIDATASDGARFVLSAQGGLCTVVYFFPKAFTPGCTTETRRFRDNYAEIALAGASIVGISTDDLKQQCEFAASLKAPFPMIGDEDRTICRAYGVLWPLVSVARRVTFVITPDLVIQAVFKHEVAIKQHRDLVLAFINERFRATRAADRPPPSAIERRLGKPSRAVPIAEVPALSLDRARLAGAAPAPPVAPATLVAPAGDGQSDSLPADLRGPVDGRFDVERKAASGASGDVYRARDRLTGGVIALKILRDGPGRDDARFEREARVLAELRHPAIVAYVAHGVDKEGHAYLATEWIDGESLSKRLTREPPLTVAETLALGARVAAALGAAHERAIVHRDLTPTNLYLPGGSIRDVKLLDFGISRPTLGNQVTVPGDVVGTPGYMAPEQARGRQITARADVFSLGCVMFRCLTGRPAFEGTNMVALLLAVVSQEVPRTRDLNPAVPEPLSDLLARMLSKAPEGRPADCRAVAAELAALGAPAQA